jgi:hypothetical protein
MYQEIIFPLPSCTTGEMLKLGDFAKFRLVEKDFVAGEI